MLNELIKEYRLDNNLTQQELANKLFVSRSAVAKWEQGRGFPSEDILQKLSELVNVPIEKLLSEKELLSLTVENSTVVKKHKTFLYFIIPLIALLIISVLVLYSISLSPKEQVPEPTIFTKDAYNIARVKNDKLTFITGHGINFNIELTDENNQNIPCTNKYGGKLNLKDIKDGYRLKINYTYNSQTKSSTVNSISVIDDYIANEYYIYGFFLSTEEFVGESAPIYDHNDPNCYYELNGVLHPISDWYPISEIFYNSMYSSRITCLTPLSPPSREYVYSLSLYKDVEKVFVYVLDNSEKGFNLHTVTTLIGSQTVVTIEECAVFNESYKYQNYQYPYKTDYRIRITINKEYPPSILKVSEYDSEHNLIKTTSYTTYEEVSYITYKLQHSTNYIEVIQNLDDCGIFTKGSTVNVTLKNKYGFILDTHFYVS